MVMLPSFSSFKRKGLLILCLMCSYVEYIVSEETPNTYLHSIQSDSDQVFIKLRSNRAYFVGGERYYLTLGDIVVMRSRHEDQPSEYGLTFLMDKDQFQALENGVAMTLSYGSPKVSRLQWPLGVLNKNVLQ